MKKVKVTEQNIKAIKKNIKTSIKKVIKVKKPKKETIASILKQRQLIKSDLFDYVSNNRDKYCIVYSHYMAGNAAIIGKKQILTVHSVNENSVFQPVEKKETRSYLTMFIVQWGTVALSDADRKDKQYLIDLGCDLVYIMSVDDIKNKLG